jgi:hypothetical protein
MDVLQNLINRVAVFQSPIRAEIAMPQGANLKVIRSFFTGKTPFW